MVNASPKRILQEPSPQLTLCLIKKFCLLVKLAKNDLRHVFRFASVVKDSQGDRHNQPVVAVEDNRHGIVITRNQEAHEFSV
jgi:hypothetical protein